METKNSNNENIKNAYLLDLKRINYALKTTKRRNMFDFLF